MFENKKTSKGIHYSRYIASFAMYENPRHHEGIFKLWLFSLGLSSEEVREIWEMASCGKFELEEEIRDILKKV